MNQFEIFINQHSLIDLRFRFAWKMLSDTFPINFTGCLVIVITNQFNQFLVLFNGPSEFSMSIVVTSLKSTEAVESRSICSQFQSHFFPHYTRIEIFNNFLNNNKFTKLFNELIFDHFTLSFLFSVSVHGRQLTPGRR